MESPATAIRDDFDGEISHRIDGLQEMAGSSYYYDTEMPSGAPKFSPSNKQLHSDRPPDAKWRLSARFSAYANSILGRGPAEKCVSARSPVGGKTKRLMDIIVSALALTLLAPLLLFVSILILLTLKRPVFYSQLRVGYDGRLFRCYKFRSMAPDSDKVLKQYLASNPAAAEEWQRTQKLTHDPRVRFIGHLLRKSSIDELPQLYNVLRGEMSCVGPRPIVADELKRYGPARDDYLKAKPGMTGLWQVSGRNVLSYEARVVLDSTYIHNWSFMSDIGILLKTIPAVIRFRETS